MAKQSVLFVCIHNSARSQMAEEILRKLAGDRFDVMSAGIEPGRLNPFVVEVLREQGIEISGKATRSVAEVVNAGVGFDYVVTVCDETSAERCPIFPGVTKRLHWGFADPSAFIGTDTELMDKTREVFGQIEQKIRAWLCDSW
jgi:arsenate reductase (thioredoxin)